MLISSKSTVSFFYGDSVTIISQIPSLTHRFAVYIDKDMKCIWEGLVLGPEDSVKFLLYSHETAYVGSSHLFNRCSGTDVSVGRL